MNMLFFFVLLCRHHLYKCFNQAALLAGPGGIMVCMMLALCANQVLQFNWSWNYCFLFGSILCATDPVSVVSLLKSTKASTKLTMIISGESLLNDGSAMILYIFFYKMINGTVFTAGTLIAFCAENVDFVSFNWFGAWSYHWENYEKNQSTNQSSFGFSDIVQFHLRLRIFLCCWFSLESFWCLGMCYRRCYCIFYCPIGCTWRSHFPCCVGICRVGL